MKSRRFWLATLAALLGMAVTLALGFWQLGRAHQKLALQAAIEQRKALAPLGAGVLLGTQDLAELYYRPIVLRGSWVGRETVFLDNRQMQARVGFYVITPLRLAGSQTVVLVQRGWVPRNFIERERLPDVSTPTGEVEVHGTIAPPPAKLYDFAKAQPGRIRQNLDLAAFRAETGLNLLDVSVQERGPASEGLLRDWPPPATGVEKHYGYAFQWWALCGLIAILYAWFQFIAPRRLARPA